MDDYCGWFDEYGNGFGDGFGTMNGRTCIGENGFGSGNGFSTIAFGYSFGEIVKYDTGTGTGAGTDYRYGNGLGFRSINELKSRDI